MLQPIQKILLALANVIARIIRMIVLIMRAIYHILESTVDCIGRIAQSLFNVIYTIYYFWKTEPGMALFLCFYGACCYGAHRALLYITMPILGNQNTPALKRLMVDLLRHIGVLVSCILPLTVPFPSFWQNVVFPRYRQYQNEKKNKKFPPKDGRGGRGRGPGGRGRGGLALR